MSSTAIRYAKGKASKRRITRVTSNVFAMLTKDQIQEFKEAFDIMDQDHDGFVSKDDLHDLFSSLGKNPSDEYLQEMLDLAPGQINFTVFLTMFGERMQCTDPEDVIRNAFACFDEEATGKISEERLKELLMTMGERFTEEQVDEIFRDAPIKDGVLNYLEFIKVLK